MLNKEFEKLKTDHPRRNAGASLVAALRIARLRNFCLTSLAVIFLSCWLVGVQAVSYTTPFVTAPVGSHFACVELECSSSANYSNLEFY